MSFTHLRVRSGYSLMNSTITIEKLIEHAKELQFDALALTDEKVLYGAIPFYKACMKAGMKPIIGLTVKVENDDEAVELVLLAKNKIGYHNLIRLTTHLQVERLETISLSSLQTYTESLVGIFPLQESKLASILLHAPHDKAIEYLTDWQKVFNLKDFYLGLENNGNQEELNRSVKAFYEKYGIPVVPIGDVRYLEEKDDIAFDVLQAIKTGRPWEMKRSTLTVKGKHLKSKQELEKSFAFWTELEFWTREVVDKCNVNIDFSQRLLPSFPVPEAMSAHEYLEKQCLSLVKKRYNDITEDITKRLRYELEVIRTMGFSDYFLIVADFIQFARDKNILVGPGRGSSAGSLVAYVLGITNVDPLKYHLLFERFLNPERQTMPDIDVDFSDERRDEVIAYVREKYGEEHVAQIITFGTFAARSLIRELIKVLEIDDQEARFILKEIPLQSKQSISQIVLERKELQDYIKQSNKLKVLFTVAIKLEGIPRHTSTHAAGVVISEQPLVEHVPLSLGANDTLLTQFTMNDLESLGLLKMDFLGLRNLSMIEKIIQSIQYSHHKQIDLDKIPEVDKNAFELLRTGKTNGVFQLESQGMKNVLTQLKPTSFEDIVAVNALFRPGPMDFIPRYIARKHKKEEVTYLHPDLEPILGQTYGVLVYQEQIMQIAHVIAGFSMGEADILRRAVSKKNKEVMDEQRNAFINGCKKNGYDEKIANEIFSWIVKFSNYGFPRSHAVAYSKISYQLSYLKANYPADFFAVLLSSVRNQSDKREQYYKEMRDFQISLLPPSINHSFGKYTVENKQIRIGLSQIKGVGNPAIQEINRVRKSGRIKNIFDLCLRADTKIINRTTLENLIMAGAFDETYSNRASLLASIDQAMEQGELFREFTDQPSLFQDQLELEASYVEIEDFSIVKKLADEKELIGTYVSSHPLKEYRESLRGAGYIPLQNVQHLVGKKDVKSVVIIEAIKTIRTKRGESMAFLTISDETNDIDAVLFPEQYRNTNRWLKEEAIIIIKGKIETRNSQIQWVINELEPFQPEMLHRESKQRLFIKVTNDKSENALGVIKRLANEHPGNVPVIIYQERTKQTYRLSVEYNVTPNRECLQALRNYFLYDNVVLQKID
ncbi:DNA polymerase III subunit alpha [Oceanobacillus piezotolerans]|uniref:DNA polymerase III subunit alpha n=1 Tax=Oceanobacillus piezotolerans TaxID=2448030 RepID=A0A498DFA0_9BACI|nr:DNA polymerase III subunit alpha [Oceanobacillus piezotolerans]RLL47878.1 DNA polymerase III subunit alpha [Oceanobacillus piezotolerans]